MAKIAIMQPYVFPYIGYFQLIQAVDTFVFYNDVNFIKKGWINRNKLLANGQEWMFTIPCKNVSQNRKICETQVAWDSKDKNKMLSTVELNYKRAPFFQDTFEIITQVVQREEVFIDRLAINSVRAVCDFLSIERGFIESNDRYHNEDLKKEHRLIDICKKEQAHDYINPSGGMTLYTKDTFEKEGINLHFLKSREVFYDQNTNTFAPWLSIIDVLMFNGREGTLNIIREYDLI